MLHALLLLLSEVRMKLRNTTLYLRKYYLQLSESDFVFIGLALVVCSIENWTEDLYFRQLDLKYPGVTGAMVSNLHYSSIISLSLPRIHLLYFIVFCLVIGTNWSYFGARCR